MSRETKKKLRNGCQMGIFLFSKEYKGLHTYVLLQASNMYTLKYLSTFFKKFTNAEQKNIGPIFTEKIFSYVTHLKKNTI